MFLVNERSFPGFLPAYLVLGAGSGDEEHARKHTHTPLICPFSPSVAFASLLFYCYRHPLKHLLSSHFSRVFILAT